MLAPTVQDLLRSIAPRGMCNPCIGALTGLVGTALAIEINALSRDPFCVRFRAQCARCGETKILWRRAFAMEQSTHEPN